MKPTIRSASLSHYPEVARSVGLDPLAMLKRAKVPRSCFQNPDIRISADAVAELLQASASAARVDDFALRLAQRRGLSNLGPLALIVREQPTVRKAIEVLIQYIALHSDALCPHLEEKDRVVTISRMLSGQRVRTCQALELSVANHQGIPRPHLAARRTVFHAQRPETSGNPQALLWHTGAIQRGLRWNRLQSS